MLTEQSAYNIFHDMSLRKVLPIKSDVRGIDFRWCHWCFSVTQFLWSWHRLTL